jgi:hypothetical protein
MQKYGMKLFMGYTIKFLLYQPKQHVEQYYQDDYAKDRPYYSPYHLYMSRAKKEINPMNTSYWF